VSNELFRKKALAKYLRVDAPGALLTIAPPWTMVVFGAMAALFVALVLIATFGRAQMAAQGRGIVRPDAPPVVLRAPLSGTVVSVTRAPHDSGKGGQLLATMDAHSEIAALDRCMVDLKTDRADLAALDKRLAEWNDTAGHERDASMALVLLSQIRTQREKTTAGARRCETLEMVVTKSQITFPVDAVVEDVAVSVGSQVHEGDVLATLSPTSARLVGYMACGEQYRTELTPGLPVRMKFDALPSDAVGVGSARVTRVLDALPSGVKIENAPNASVFAELVLDPVSSGAVRAHSGMTFSADVLTSRQSVLALIFSDP
jgi:multidrug resistance efflux pump